MGGLIPKCHSAAVGLFWEAAYCVLWCCIQNEYSLFRRDNENIFFSRNTSFSKHNNVIYRVFVGLHVAAWKGHLASLQKKEKKVQRKKRQFHGYEARAGNWETARGIMFVCCLCNSAMHDCFHPACVCFVSVGMHHSPVIVYLHVQTCALISFYWTCHITWWLLMWDDLFFCPPAQGAEGDIPHASKHPPVTSRKIRKAWLVSQQWLTRVNYLMYSFISNVLIWGLKIYLKHYNVLYLPNEDDLPTTAASLCSLSKKCANSLISHNIKFTG